MKYSILLTAILTLSNGAVLAQEEYIQEEEDAEDRHYMSCVACHVVEHDDDFYTRKNTYVKSLSDLRRQVGACMVSTGVGWFPEEEAGEVKFLNDNYYKLQK
ncbi:hypothetical protein [Candidatus Thioglobus sp.]|uniref:hypothetical protein n=1 Tax=Candidatus Thioglobus sp. TaxID=2026721 RepID=UPI003D145A2A